MPFFYRNSNYFHFPIMQRGKKDALSASITILIIYNGSTSKKIWREL